VAGNDWWCREEAMRYQVALVKEFSWLGAGVVVTHKWEAIVSFKPYLVLYTDRLVLVVCYLASTRLLVATTGTWYLVPTNKTCYFGQILSARQNLRDFC